MKKQIKNTIVSLQRTMSLFAVVGLLFASASGIVEAAATGGQVQARSIRMSDSGKSGGTITSGVGSGTNVTYRVTFKAASSYTLKGVVLDFCNGTGGTPFIGDTTCAAPTGFTVGSTPTIDTSNYGSVTGLGSSWTATSTNSGQTFKMTNSTSAPALTSGTSYTFAISGITNPSDLGTFYARLITYASDTVGIGSYAHNDAGTYQDYGGFALSTASVVEITAKVQETLTFCVSGSATKAQVTDPDVNPYAGTPLCTASTAPAIILGHGDTRTLSPDVVDAASVYTLASTNALNGVSIRMRNSNGNGSSTCGGLSTDDGTTCAIPPIGGGAAVLGDLIAGTAAFGMRCTDATGGTGVLPCDINYFDSTHATYYSMDTATAGENVTSTYGDVVATSSAPVNAVSNEFTFAATASNTTPAGIYKANMSMIATGTF